ncbi:hypothetical protein [Bacillus toyonensis]|uniref:hypothetical protein n=1 Tax=Bacillus toyonensis TaxID=155322 RepID=UPI0015CF5873|nr:hypothetical protein [Bacillus toyonensis]
MMQSVVVKATSSGGLQSRINESLKELIDMNIVDVKITGSFDGKDDNYIALILYTI